MLLVPCLLLTPGTPQTCDNATWEGTVMTVMQIKRCFDTGDATQNITSRHKLLTQNMFWQKSLSWVTDYWTRILPPLKYLLSGDHRIVQSSNPAMIPREPDVFICDSLSPDQNRGIDKQDPSQITDEQSEPGWHSHRCVNHPSHWSSTSPMPCFLLTINEITEKIFFIFCHMLISTLWWKR